MVVRAPVRIGWIVGAADHLAHRAFGHRLHGAFGVLDVEQEVADAVGLDAPQHGEVDVDDVLVAGQHQAFFRHVAHGAAAPRRIVDQGHADGDGGDAQRLRQQHGLDRIRQMIVQAGLHGAHMLAEAQHHAELFGLHAEEAGQAPDRERAEQHQGDAHAAEMSARQQLLHLVLAAAQQVFKIRRARADRLRTLSPMVPLDPSPRAPRLDFSTPSIVSLTGGRADWPRLRRQPGFIGDRQALTTRGLPSNELCARRIFVNANIG